MRRLARSAGALLLALAVAGAGIVAAGGIAAAADPPRRPIPRDRAPPAGAATATAGARSLEYVEIVAGAGPSVDGDDPLPMIVMIHGLGGRPLGLAQLLDGVGPPLRIILPRAPERFDAGYSWIRPRAKSAEPAVLARALRGAAKDLAALVADLVVRRPTRGKPIIMGFSQGGMLTFTLAVEHGHLFSAAVPLAGLLPEPLWPNHVEGRAPPSIPPIHAFHGNADAVVPFEQGRRTIAHLRAIGVEAALREYPRIDHRMSRPMVNDLHALLRTLVGRVEQPVAAVRPPPPAPPPEIPLWSAEVISSAPDGVPMTSTVASLAPPAAKDTSTTAALRGVLKKQVLYFREPRLR